MKLGLWNSYKPSALLALNGIIVSCAIIGFAETYNWNRWKGPDQNGISKETAWDPSALDKLLTINWKINVGPGYSNVSINGDYLYTMGYDVENESNILYCIDVKTGDEVWRHTRKTSKGKYEGPKCTPVVDEGLVYSLSQDGDFLCNDALTGEKKWERQVVDELGAEMLKWKLSSSILIEGDLAIVNAGSSGIAVNKKSGATVWKSDPGKGNYATPVSFKKGGETYVAVYGSDHLYGVRVKNGSIAWSFPWDTKYSIIAADPYIYREKVFVSSGYDTGCALLDISGKKPKELWRSKNMSTHFSTAVIIDGYIYGVNGNAGSDASLTCLDIKDGSVAWSKELGFGNMISANNYLIMITEHGSLYIVKADPKGYQEVSKTETGVLPKLCWTAPVLCRSTLYVRNNKGDLISIDLSKQK